jgi:hypothetical protein
MATVAYRSVDGFTAGPMPVHDCLGIPTPSSIAPRVGNVRVAGVPLALCALPLGDFFG